MQDKNRHLEMLQALAAGTDPITGEIFPANSPYNQPEITQLEALAEKGNQGLAWSDEEDISPTQHFVKDIKIIQLAKLHSRTYGTIKARLIKLSLLQK